MSFEQIIFLSGFSFCHVLFPGHPTPLLLATGEMGLEKAWKFILGMAISHGLLGALRVRVTMRRAGMLSKDILDFLR